METKKSNKVNLEKNKSTNLLMGVVVAMAMLFVSFEWGTAEQDVFLADMNDGIEWVDEIPITIAEPTPPPPPPPAPAVVDMINVVDDEVDVDTEVTVTTEDAPDIAQPEPYLPPVAIDDEDEDANTIFVVVEEMPLFPGGDPALLKFVNGAIKYPVIAQENGIQGRVVCSFVVNRDGSVVDAEVIRGVDPSLDKEALRVIGTMPNWKPGMQRGKPVRVKYTIPITFRLQ